MINEWNLNNLFTLCSPFKWEMRSDGNNTVHYSSDRLKVSMINVGIVTNRHALKGGKVSGHAPEGNITAIVHKSELSWGRNSPGHRDWLTWPSGSRLHATGNCPVIMTGEAPTQQELELPARYWQLSSYDRRGTHTAGVLCRVAGIVSTVVMRHQYCLEHEQLPLVPLPVRRCT
jgi:hypothetical protein